MDRLIKKSKLYKGVRDYQVQASLYPGYIEIRVKLSRISQWVFFTTFLEALPENPFDLQRYILKTIGVSYADDTYSTWVRIAAEAIKAINEFKQGERYC